MESDILKLTRLCYVPRWVIVPMLRHQSVAEHSYRVTLIVMTLVESKKWSAGSIGALIREALIHDAEEIYTGDIPSSAKDAVKTTYASLRFHDDSVPPIYGFIIKVADIVEALTWFKKNHNVSETRYADILGSMLAALHRLKDHPHFDRDVFGRAEQLIHSEEIE